MKILLWGTFALIALLWTAGAALLAQIAQWFAGGLAGVGETSAEAVAAIAIPPWLAPWIDSTTWTAWLQSLGAALSSLSALLPGLEDLAAWMSPIVWAAWGVGLIGLLGLTLTGNWMISRLQPGTQTRTPSI
ncbi:hypothetical protein ACWKW4_20225 [Hydrogenophaga borbori]|jgi:hypothetical protein